MIAIILVKLPIIVIQILGKKVKQHSVFDTTLASPSMSATYARPECKERCGKLQTKTRFKLKACFSLSLG